MVGDPERVGARDGARRVAHASQRNSREARVQNGVIDAEAEAVHAKAFSCSIGHQLRGVGTYSVIARRVQSCPTVWRRGAGWTRAPTSHPAGGCRSESVAQDPRFARQRGDVPAEADGQPQMQRKQLNLRGAGQARFLHQCQPRVPSLGLARVGESW